MKRLALLVLALLLPAVACGAGFATPDELVRELYAARERKEGPFFAQGDLEALERWLIPAFAELVRDDAAAAGDEVGTIDGDPLLDAQDWELAKFQIHPATLSDEDSAEVRVTFTNFDQPRTILYHLQRDDASGWRVANIEYADYSLYRALRDAAEAREPAE